MSEPNVSYHQLNATLVPFMVHGWKILRRKMRAGQSYVVEVAQDSSDPLTTDNIALWVAGRIAGSTDVAGLTPPDRVAGFCTLDRSFVPAGRHSFAVLEDAEWWCFTRQLNQGQLPTVQPIRIDAGESVVLDQGDRLAMCFGQYSVNGAAASGLGVYSVNSDAATLQAITPSYGFKFLE
jgi:hypothetical protein